jgi:hypothetical protein
MTSERAITKRIMAYLRTVLGLSAKSALPRRLRMTGDERSDLPPVGRRHQVVCLGLGFDSADGRVRAGVMMATTPPRWCERCFHPIDPSEAVFVEAYRLVGDFSRKAYLHDHCFDPANPAYLDALMRYSDGRVMMPIKAPSKPAEPRAARSRGGRARRLRGKAHRPRRQRR